VIGRMMTRNENDYRGYGKKRLNPNLRLSMDVSGGLT
jgi:hypothetical protein